MYVSRFTRKVFWVLLFVICFYLYYTLNNTQWTWYLHNKVSKQICILPDSEMKDMVNLTRTAHSVLTMFNLTHMPFYGRYGGLNLIRFAIIVYESLFSA